MKIAILGPTASGKSGLASKIAQIIHGTVINGDPFQAYADLPIGTGQPTDQEKGEIPHLGYGTLPLTQSLNPEDFGHRVRQDIHQTQTALLVTGSGLYLRGIWNQLSELPAVPEEITLRVRRWTQELGGPRLHRYLESVDPLRAKQLHPNDASRIQRALALHLATGGKASELLDGICKGVHEGWRGLLVLPDRESLKERISRRVQFMIETGWEQEVRRIQEKRLEVQLRQLRPLGYLEWLDMKDPAIIQAEITRQTQGYAKRQCTFFRNQWPEIPVWNPDTEPVETALARLGIPF